MICEGQYNSVLERSKRNYSTKLKPEIESRQLFASYETTLSISPRRPIWTENEPHDVVLQQSEAKVKHKKNSKTGRLQLSGYRLY